MFKMKLENSVGNIVDINDGVKYQVIAVSGLNPPSASIFTAKSPNRKGLKYNGSTLDERNIIITIKILGNVEANRNALYDWTNTEQYVKIRYRNGVKNVYCEGYVQDCDIDLFTDNEVIDLAVLCTDPYWKDLQAISADISSVLGLFKFPFAIDNKGIPLCSIRTDNTTHIYNSGAETGVKITIKCLNEVENLAIYNARNSAERFKIEGTLQKGWILVVDTESNPKVVTLYKPDGTEENYTNRIAKNPTWFTLKKGDNYFGYASDNGTSNVEIFIDFTNKYLGV